MQRKKNIKKKNFKINFLFPNNQNLFVIARKKKATQ